jgi:nitrogen fixation NifU-like protein
MGAYTKEILEHFQNPQNFGEMPDADAMGEAGSASDGDMVRIFLKIKDDVIIDIKAQVFGCVAAIATTSVTTILVKGKRIVEVNNISKNEVLDHLGGLSEQKNQCSNLAIDAIKEALLKSRL